MTTEIIGEALFSECKNYRYWLKRKWGDSDIVTFIMLNPSTADASIDDQTIRKCIGFTRNLGYANLSVVNLFAICSKDPATIDVVTDPVGSMNDFWIKSILSESKIIIAAWGNRQKHQKRVREVLDLCKDKINCLGTTKQGQPRHPLYVKYESEIIEFTK